MKITGYYFYISIGIIYFSFMTVIVDRILGYTQIEKACDGIYGYRIIMKDDPEKRIECDTMRKGYKTKKFIYMLNLGVVSIFIGAYLVNTKYENGGVGIALGNMI